MKIRIGFVSNSSSSSFMVAAKDNEKLKGKIMVTIDLEDNIETTISNEEELRDWLIKEHCCGEKYKTMTIPQLLEEMDEFYVNEQVEKMQEQLDNGNKIFIGRASSDYEGNIGQLLIYEKTLDAIDFEDEVEILDNGEC